MFFSFFLFLVKTYVHQLTTSEAYSKKKRPFKTWKEFGRGFDAQNVLTLSPGGPSDPSTPGAPWSPFE